MTFQTTTTVSSRTIKKVAYSKKQKENILETIFTLIAEQGYSLRKALREDGMPDAVTFYKWIDQDESKLKQYTRATNERADVIFEEIMVIADNQEDDVYEDEDGKLLTNHNVINRARLRVDSRKWMLGKMNPKKYSDKIQVDQTPFEEQPLFPISDIPSNNGTS